MNIVLVGFMGSGKTSAGRMLAEKTGRKFVDVDSIIESEHNMEVREIFSRFGEERFRELESEAVKKAAAGDGMVISTGGGAVLAPANTAALRKNGVLVWLMVSPEEALKRTAAAGTRPLLEADDRAEAAGRLLESRKQAYEESDYSVETTGRSLDEVVEELTALTEALEKNG